MPLRAQQKGLLRGPPLLHLGDESLYVLRRLPLSYPFALRDSATTHHRHGIRLLHTLVLAGVYLLLLMGTFGLIGG